MRARSIRVPGLIDMLRVRSASDIAALAEDRRLDRGFETRGPVFNRVLTSRLQAALSIGGSWLPAVARRDDAARRASQEKLAERLKAPAEPVWDDQTVAALADAVRRAQNAGAIGPLAQQAVGRLFVKDYQGTDESFAAARTLDTAVRTRNPLRWLSLRLGGGLRYAQAVLRDGVKGDLAGVHATGIAIHNLVKSFELMRDLWAKPGNRDNLSVDAVTAYCLVAPPSILRQATQPGATIAGRIRRGTLVVIDLDRIREHAPSAATVFMEGTWASCPASGAVPQLLRAVWKRALADSGGVPTP